MIDFDIDNFKKTWQEQVVPAKYESSEILQMLNKKSRNYVKYILWISVVEFLFFLGLSIYYVFQSNEEESFINILRKLGIKITPEINANFEHLYFILKIISLFVSAFFLLKFYLNFKKINVEANLKKFILQIVMFKKTVNAFIITNILLLIIFTIVITFFVFFTLKEQHIQLKQITLIGFITELLVATLLSIVLILLYYRVIYGIIMKKLEKNLKELEKIETQ